MSSRCTQSTRLSKSFGSASAREAPADGTRLADAVEYYESRESGIGIRFALEVGLTLANVLQAPERWPEIEPGIRKRNMNRFPYALIYRNVNRGLVELIAVFHLRREPGSWRKT